MGLQTIEADQNKLNTFWREIVLSDDELVTQPSPTDEEHRRRACEICLSQGATNGHDLEDWLLTEPDLCSATGNGARSPSVK